MVKNEWIKKWVASYLDVTLASLDGCDIQIVMDIGMMNSAYPIVKINIEYPIKMLPDVNNISEYQSKTIHLRGWQGEHFLREIVLKGEKCN